MPNGHPNICIYKGEQELGGSLSREVRYGCRGGLYIIMYEWEKYRVEIKTCDFGPKTVCYNPRKSSEIDIFNFQFFFCFFVSF